EASRLRDANRPYSNSLLTLGSAGAKVSMCRIIPGSIGTGRYSGATESCGHSVAEGVAASPHRHADRPALHQYLRVHRRDRPPNPVTSNGHASRHSVASNLGTAI